MKRREPSAAARDADLQDRLIEACERLSGIRLPVGGDVCAEPTANA